MSESDELLKKMAFGASSIAVNKAFMTKIRTAEEVLIRYAFDDDPSNAALKERTILCMQEYAKQFIDLAAEEAKVKEINGCYPVIDKESILKLKERVV